ncbi:MAG: VCBS repeat-containing protein [Planctomycetes bacterium]|nr:VCBS repeat-containing protein [Planctomycetota bacterium]
MIPPTLVLAAALAAGDADFERHVLDTTFYCEGAGVGDLDGDGATDVVSGPWIYLGPDFARRVALYEAKPFDPLHYSDSFFAWSRDLDGDGWLDVVQVGFPGAEAWWFENPGAAGGAWTRHLIHDTVDNESPAYVDLVGDEAPELVCCSGGAFGWLAPGADPRERWSFHALSEDLGKQRFTHGLGVGDVDGDGRADVLAMEGWWRQPADLADGPWAFHPVRFSREIGGAQMLVLDVDGDGDADVVTSQNAHGWGLSWYEQRAGGAFVEHVITGATREQNPWGVRVASPHALAACDVDGDGLTDFVSGRRHWAHGPQGDEEGDVPSAIWWFRLERRADGAVFVPHLVDDDSGVGTQVTAADVNGDGRPDVVVGNKQGTFVFVQRAAGASVDEPRRHMAPPALAPRDGGRRPRGADGRELNLGFERGDLSDWTAEGAAFLGQPVLGDTCVVRGREPSLHAGRAWVGGYELEGDAPTGRLRSASFVLDADWASFLVGGGSSQATRVELVDADGDVLCRATGADYESMKVVVVDLAAHRGARAHLELVDEATGGWGHLNFDDFLLHDERPVIDADRLALPLDVVAHAGLAPEEAAAAMTVPSGFAVDLVAAEPDLHQPVALAIDDAGRLWVAEAHSYPARRGEGQGRDVIVVFSDTDGDGAYETRTVFQEGLDLVSGLEVGHGGAWIGAAPFLYFVPDRDGDLVPDGPPEVVLDGWHYEDTHETLNAFTWGPDGWLYGCHGVFTHSRVGAPGTPDDERVPLNAGVWRLHPKTRAFEVFAWGTSNPWGVTFDEAGQAFVTACVIPHLYHLAQGGRYERQAGSHFEPWVYEDIGTIADHRHYLGATPHSGNSRSSAAGGGHAHCGALIYQGDAFPAEYRGRILMNNVHGNRVNQDVLERVGSGFVGRHGQDLLLANDAWFRGIALESGPDGCVYLTDWYDERACHSNERELWDRTNGRLYRLRYGALAPRVVDLAAASDAELVALLDHDDAWHARHALRLLQERGGAAAAEALRARVVADGAPRARCARCGRCTASRASTRRSASRSCAARTRTSRRGACSSRPRTARSPTRSRRRGSTRRARRTRRACACTSRRRSSASARRCRTRASSPRRCSRAVRTRTTRTCRTSTGTRWRACSRTTRPRGSSSRARARWSGRGAWRCAGWPPPPAGARRSAPSWRAGPARGRTTSSPRSSARWQIGAASRRPPPGPPRTRALAAGDAALRERALWLAASFGDASAVPALAAACVRDVARPDEQRVRALEALVGTEAPEVGPLLVEALTQPALRAAAVSGLARHGVDGAPAALLALVAESDLAGRRAIHTTLAAREAYAPALLAALEDGRLAREEVTASVVRVLRGYADEALAARVVALFGVERPPGEDALARIAALKAELEAGALKRADAARGRAVFARTCAQCHTLFGEGGDLAPDLTGSNRADVEYVLTNLVDPSAVIGRDYQATVVRTTDGLLVVGILKEENEEGLVLRSETETWVVRHDEVEERVLSEVSTMPNGLLETLAEGELADLVRYLGSEEQVPLPAE